MIIKNNNKSTHKEIIHTRTEHEINRQEHSHIKQQTNTAYKMAANTQYTKQTTKQQKTKTGINTK